MIDYNDAVQNPAHSFVDKELKTGSVRKNALGLPLVLSGGFALTYAVTTGSKKYAVRCFHREIPAIESKYKEISRTLRSLNNGYFVGFEFQHSGIVVKGNTFPIVRMDWIEGDPLGVWLDKNYDNEVALRAARAEFRKIAAYLETKGIAHGDIQNGNVMMSQLGIKLIDYDGMFVPGLPGGNGAEVGHKHFQHPQRSSTGYGRTMDRFSFIVLDLSLQSIIEDKTLHKRFREGGETIIFKANDFADPENSEIMQLLSRIPQLKDRVAAFAAICRADISSVPTLEECLDGKNIPKTRAPIDVTRRRTEDKKSVKYIAAFPVVDATNYSATLKHVGDRIELVGKIVEVKVGEGKYGRARSRKYMFINFGKWRGKIIKIAIWSEGLERLNNKPSNDWIGRWVSVTGLLDPPYHNRRWGYTHLSISVHDDSQIQVLDREQAFFRLNSLSSNASVAQPQGHQKAGAGNGGHSGPKTTPASSRGAQPGVGKPPAQSAAVQAGIAGTNSASKNQAIVKKFTQPGASSAATGASSSVGGTSSSVAGAPAPPAQPAARSGRGAAGNTPGSASAFIRGIPWWVWLGIVLAVLFLVGQKNPKRVGESPMLRPTTLTKVLPPSDPGEEGRPNSTSGETLAQSGSSLRPWDPNGGGSLSGGNGAVETEGPPPAGTSSAPSVQMPQVPEPAQPEFSMANPAPGAPTPEKEFVPSLDLRSGSTPGSEGKMAQPGVGPGPIDLRRPEDAKRVQTRLKELGFLIGAPDGVWGPRSNSALMAFRSANRLGQDASWDEITAEKIFSDTVTHANRGELAGFVGGWASNFDECHIGEGGGAPLTITAKRAQTSSGRCQFASVNHDSNGWRVQAICTVGTESWNANIRLMLNGNRLTWSSDRGTDVYFRCSGP
jgi:hypothetical protein